MGIWQQKGRVLALYGSRRLARSGAGCFVSFSIRCTAVASVIASIGGGLGQGWWVLIGVLVL